MLCYIDKEGKFVSLLVRELLRFATRNGRCPSVSPHEMEFLKGGILLKRELGKTYSIMDDETGEIVGKIESGDRVVKANSIEFLISNEEFDGGEFVKFGEEYKYWQQELSHYERSFLSSVALYINYKDCCVVDDNDAPLYGTALIKLTGLSNSTFYDVVKSLLNKKLIYVGEKDNLKKQYFVNPWIFYRGQSINKQLRKRYFHDYEIRQLGGIKWETLEPKRKPKGRR